jgi:hypothetical protein
MYKADMSTLRRGETFHRAIQEIKVPDTVEQ